MNTRVCLFYFKCVSFWLCWVFIAAHRLSLVAVHGPLIAVASLVAEHELSGVWASVAVHGLSCPAALWNLPSPQGLNPCPPALAGGFLTTGPPWKSRTPEFIIKPLSSSVNVSTFSPWKSGCDSDKCVAWPPAGSLVCRGHFCKTAGIAMVFAELTGTHRVP